MPPEFDLDASMNQLADTLADDSGGAGDMSTGPGGSSGTGALPPPVDPRGGANPPPAAGAQPEEWRTPPKSWKSDYHSYWGTMDPKAQQYIYQREKEQLDGITKYKGEVDGWNQIFEPYQQLFGESGLNPREATQRLIDAHVMLTYGTPEQKREWGEYLIKNYGLDGLLQAAAAASPGTQQQPDPVESSPQFKAMKEQFDRLQASIENQQRLEHNQRVQAANAEIEAFMSAPENEFAKQVLPTMVQIMRGGMAKDLKQAYSLACKLDDGVAATLAQRALEKQAPAGRPRVPRNVQSSQTEPLPTAGKRGSWEDELSETFDKINPRH